MLETKQVYTPILFFPPVAHVGRSLGHMGHFSGVKYPSEVGHRLGHLGHWTKR